MTPAPTPDPQLVTQLDVTASNFLVGVLIFLGTLLIIGLALWFALQYHRRLLQVIETAVKKSSGNLNLAAESYPAFEQSGLTTWSTAAAQYVLTGPSQLVPGDEGIFLVAGADETPSFEWEAAGGEPESGSYRSFVTVFAKPGAYVVRVKVSVPTSDPDKPDIVVLVKAVVVAPKAATSPPAVNLPFVVNNWGRLVVVLFGVGVIGTLISTRVLDAAAGVGILGTLLGVGAAGALSGSNGGKQASDPTKPKPDEEA